MELVPQDARAKQVAAERATQERPDDAMAWLAFSQACDALVETKAAHAAARRALELAPDNVDAIRQLAASLSYSTPGNSEARPLFERVLQFAPTDAVALHYLHYYSMFEGDYRRAIELAETLDRHHPGSMDTAARIGRAYRLLGDRTAAAEHYAQAAERTELAQFPFPYGPYAAMKPVFAALAGDQAASERLSSELCRQGGIGIADLSKSIYPNDCAEAIDRLQARVAGRDIYIFGFGPSLAEITARTDDFVALDFSAMTISNFPLIEENLLAPIGRRIDIVCITHPVVLESHAANIRSWFSDLPTAVLAMPLWLRGYADRTGGPDFLLGRSDHLFWFDAFNDVFPASPADPLQIPAVNSLICALGVALLAKPRRIFLFGFDGRIKGDDSQRPDALYFKEDDKSYYTPHRSEAEARQLIKANLWWDTLRFDELASITLRHLALLFDLPHPPIYNVCPDSALESFPRISIDRFLQLTSGR